MKAKISLLLVLVLLLGLFCGCGKGNEVIVGGDADDQQSVSKPSDDKLTEALKSVKWTDGVVADGVYSNECLGLQFQIPEDWVQASEEETRTILNADPNDKTTIYDVLLGPKDMSAIMSLVCIDLRQQIGGTSMTEDEMLQEMEDGMLEDGSLGDASFSDMETITLFGRDYRSAVLTASVSGGGLSVSVSSRILLSRLGKDKVVMVNVRAATEELVDYYMAHFTDDPATIPEPPAAATPESTFTRGVIEGGSYINESLALRYDAPEGWVFSTDQELAETMGLSRDYVGDEIFDDPAALNDLIAQQSTIFDMTATAPDNTALVQLAVEYVDGVTGGAELTVDDYAEILIGQLDGYTIGDLEQRTLAGKPFTMIPAVLADAGIYQYLYITRVDGNMMLITLTGLDDSVLAYETCFTQF